MEKIKVSFDFDGTLTRSDVQRFVKYLNHTDELEIHITTSRSLDNDMYDNDHIDLFEVAEKLKISKDNIHFLDYKDKAIFFQYNSDFHFHLDDCWIEIDQINKYTDVIGVCVLDKRWRPKCSDLINKNVLMELDKDAVRKHVYQLIKDRKDEEMPQLLMKIKEDIEKMIEQQNNVKPFINEENDERI